MLSDKLTFTKSKWYGYIIIALYGFVAILIIFLVINIINLEQYKPIANLQFEESKWIKINSANFYTRIGERAITPNDQVTLVLNVTNKVPLNIMIEPEFHTYQAGKLVDIRNVSHMVYGHEYTGIFTRNYFPTSEGLNVIKVALKISYSNGTFLTYQNTTTVFDVISKTDKLQMQQNDYLLIGVIASSFIGGGTVLALAFNVHFSRKEVDHLEKQAKTENRPWLGATTMMTINRAPLQLIFHYKNYGKFPANDVEEKHGFSNEMLSKDAYERELDGKKVPHTSVILPDQGANYTIGGITEEIANRLSELKPLFLAIIIDYTFGENKKGRYGVIFEYRHAESYFTVRKEWAE